MTIKIKLVDVGDNYTLRGQSELKEFPEPNIPITIPLKGVGSLDKDVHVADIILEVS